MQEEELVQETYLEMRCAQREMDHEKMKTIQTTILTCFASGTTHSKAVMSGVGKLWCGEAN